MSPLLFHKIHMSIHILQHTYTRFTNRFWCWLCIFRSQCSMGLFSHTSVIQIMPSMPCRHCQPTHTRDEGHLLFQACPFLIMKFFRKFHLHLVFCGIWPPGGCYVLSHPLPNCFCDLQGSLTTPSFMQNLPQFATLKYPHLLGESCSSHCKPFTEFECAFSHIFCHLWVIGSHWGVSSRRMTQIALSFGSISLAAVWTTCEEKQGSKKGALLELPPGCSADGRWQQSGLSSSRRDEDGRTVVLAGEKDRSMYSHIVQNTNKKTPASFNIEYPKGAGNTNLHTTTGPPPCSSTQKHRQWVADT